MLEWEGRACCFDSEFSIFVFKSVRFNFKDLRPVISNVFYFSYFLRGLESSLHGVPRRMSYQKFTMQDN